MLRVWPAHPENFTHGTLVVEGEIVHYSIIPPEKTAEFIPEGQNVGVAEDRYVVSGLLPPKPETGAYDQMTALREFVVGQNAAKYATDFLVKIG